MKNLVDWIPGVEWLSQAIGLPPSQRFTTSEEYWRRRYKAGGNSGQGSYGKLAEFKAAVLNRFVTENKIGSVIEFGCGDGNQLSLAEYPHYVGFDVSLDSIERCRSLFASDATKEFLDVEQYDGHQAELCLSLDVIYHLVEDEVFDQYMQRLFASATRFVIIYSTNYDAATDSAHVRHRMFSNWIDRHASQWTLQQHIPNRYPIADGEEEASNADFLVYQR